MRRLIAALVIVIILVACWVGGWFWLAGWLDRKAGPALQEAANRGIEIDCPGRTVVGFPFAIRIACGATDVSERSSGTHASLAGATGGASIFSPMTASVNLQSPARLESPLLQAPLDFRWQGATVNVAVGAGGPKTVSFNATDFLGALALPGDAAQTVTAAKAEASLAPSANGGSDLAARFTDLALALGTTHFPPVSGSASAELSVPPNALARGRAGIRLPVEARSIEVSIESGGARFMVEGDLAVSDGGIVDGTMVLRVAGAEALPAFIAALPDRFQKIGNAVAAGLFAFGQPTTIDGKPASELRVPIERSRAQVGPIAVDLPKLPL